MTDTTSKENNDDIIIEEYIRLSDLGKTTKEQQDRLKPAVIKIVQERGNLDLPGHTLTLSQYKTWKYPEEVKALEKQFKEAKKVAELNGSATCKESPMVTCSRKKV